MLDREITVLSRSKNAASIGRTIVRGPRDVERNRRNASAEDDLLPFAGEVDRAVLPELAYPLAERLELVVGVIWIVMEQEEPSRGRETGEVGDVMGAGVTEPGALRLFLLRVLAVVDQNVDARGDLEPGHPLGLDLRQVDGQRRLVVG